MPGAHGYKICAEEQAQGTQDRKENKPTIIRHQIDIQDYN